MGVDLPEFRGREVEAEAAGGGEVGLGDEVVGDTVRFFAERIGGERAEGGAEGAPEGFLRGGRRRCGGGRGGGVGGRRFSVTPRVWFVCCGTHR